MAVQPPCQLLFGFILRVMFSQRETSLTIHSQVAQCGRGGSLDLNIMRLEQEENRLQCIPIDSLDI